MKTSVKWLAAAAVLAVAAYIAADVYLGSRSTTQGQIGLEIQERAAATLAVNPVQQWREEIDRDELDKSLTCVAADGTMTCGKYQGQQALVHVALIGARDRIPELSTRQILVAQGDQAVAAAAAVGDLETVKMLVAQGAAHDLLNENRLQAYPLFAGGYDKGAHPAGSAAEFGHVNVLAFFVERGFDVNAKLADDGVTDSFLQALMRQKIDVLRYLLDHDYRLSCTFRFRNGRTYAELADALGFSEGASLIRERCHR
jgi:Ankyrin repeats (many copies)